MVKVYFPITFDLFRHWRGGYNLIEGALSALPKDQVEIETLYVYPEVAEQKGLDQLGVPSRHAGQFEAMDYLSQQYARRPKDSVFISLGHCGLWSIAMKRVVYVPDFQHEYLEQNFSAEELGSRRLGYQVEFATADGLWMSSFAVQRDLGRFVVNSPRRQLVLPFPSLRDHWSITENPPVSGPFVLCVSQGWPHKNIDRLIQSWKSLGVGQESWTLVIAGYGVDAIHSSYPYLKIMSGVDDGTLGWLYQNASLFVLPSLFEGWSTPVEEAIRFQLPMALSDIPILREQAPHGALFFDPSNVTSIANCLRELISQPDRRKLLKQALSHNSRLTLQEYGARLFQFLKEIR